MTADQRFRAVLELTAVAEALARAGGTWEAQLKRQHQVEVEWQQFMREFLKAHVAGGGQVFDGYGGENLVKPA